MPIFEEPLSRHQAAILRDAVLAFRMSQHRRVFPPSVHVGELAGREESLVLNSPALNCAESGGRRRSSPAASCDSAQRADLVGMLIDRYVGRSGARGPALWLTRPGEVGHPYDLDLAWLAAGRQAFAEVALPLTMVVITRQGWYDPRSCVVRRWRRLRSR
ncbi:MAG: hypothetical protein ACRCYU_00535 [Nocardioides sp.]